MKKTNYEYKKRFVRRLLSFLIVETLFICIYISIQQNYSEANLHNTEQMICEIDDIYFVDTFTRNDPYHIIIDGETYKLYWEVNQPKSMKDVKEQLLLEPLIKVTIKKK